MSHDTALKATAIRSPEQTPEPAEPWIADALCAEIDPELWFPEKGGSTRPAKAFCRECEVRAECLRYALENDIGPGIWGGLSDRERRRIRKGRAA